MRRRAQGSSGGAARPGAGSDGAHIYPAKRVAVEFRPGGFRRGVSLLGQVDTSWCTGGSGRCAADGRGHMENPSDGCVGARTRPAGAGRVVGRVKPRQGPAGSRSGVGVRGRRMAKAWHDGSGRRRGLRAREPRPRRGGARSLRPLGGDGDRRVLLLCASLLFRWFHRTSVEPRERTSMTAILIFPFRVEPSGLDHGRPRSRLTSRRFDSAC